MAWSLLDSPDTPSDTPDTIRSRPYECDASRSDKSDSHTCTDRNLNRPPPAVPYTMDIRPHRRYRYLSSSSHTKRSIHTVRLDMIQFGNGNDLLLILRRWNVSILPQMTLRVGVDLEFGESASIVDRTDRISMCNCVLQSRIGRMYQLVMLLSLEWWFESDNWWMCSCCSSLRFRTPICSVDAVHCKIEENFVFMSIIFNSNDEWLIRLL